MTELPTIDCFEVALHTTTKDIYCNNIYIYISVCVYIRQNTGFLQAGNFQKQLL